MLRPAALLVLGLALAAPAPPAAAQGTVRVLYAGSLVSLMERGIGPGFDRTGGGRFEGYAGGSSKLANEITGRLRRGDVFISADPKVDDRLMGPANGDWVRWYIVFARSPLVIGYNPRSRFAGDIKTRPWYEALAEPGIKIGRTDPRLDPKGALTVALLERAAVFYKQPDLLRRVLGSPENPAQILPEETLVGRLQSGELDAGFFYSTETSDAKIPEVSLPAEIAPEARYTATALKDAANPSGAERFIVFLLSPEGRALMKQHGLGVIEPRVGGDAQAVPGLVRALIATLK